MHLLRHFIDRKLTIAWIVVLAVVTGSFSPALHALASADTGPGGAICSALGVMAGPDSKPQPAPAHGPQHCNWCVIHTVAGMPPAALVLPRPVAAPSLEPERQPAQTHAATAEAYAGPRGPPRVA